jgi:hypothetical protein
MHFEGTDSPVIGPRLQRGALNGKLLVYANSGSASRLPVRFLYPYREYGQDEFQNNADVRYQISVVSVKLA